MTFAEIERQIGIHSDRRRQIVNERAALYAATLKSGGRSETWVADADERAAREHAKNLLNGAAPESLSLPPEVDRDRLLLREQRGIDIAIKILGSDAVLARATAAVAWGEAHADEWRRLTREVVLTSIRLEALKRRIGQFFEQCPDSLAVQMPLAGKIDGREVELDELIAAALAEGVITSSEIRKAENG